MIAICLRGPGGVGKTTIAYALGAELRSQSILGDEVGYVSADMFAHTLFDCRYTQREMDVKYQLIAGAVRHLASLEYPLIYDDTFKRQQDYDFVNHLLSSLSYRICWFALSAPLEMVLERNRERFWKERLSDEKVRLYHEINSRLRGQNETVIDTQQAISVSVAQVVAVVKQHLDKPGSFGTIR